MALKPAFAPLALEQRIWLLLIVASGLLAILLGFFSPEQFRLGLYIKWSIPIAMLSSAMLILAVIAYFDSFRDNNHRYFDAFLAVGIAVVVWIAIPGRTVMEADESSMISTAQGIYFNFSPYSTVTGVFANDGTFISFYEKLDKRGVFFPLWIAVLDYTLGPDPDHRLGLSWLSGLLIIFLSLRLSRRYLPPAVVPAIPIFLVSMPVFTIHMRGGTFDTMNVAVLLLLIHAFLSFWHRPSHRRIFLLVASAAVVGQIRNESLLISGITIIATIARIALSAQCSHFRSAWIFLLPWTLVPSAIRRAVPFDNELPEATLEIWSFNNFQDNISALVQVILFGGYYNYGNAIIGFAAVIGVALLLVQVWRSKVVDLDLRGLLLLSGMLALLPTVIMFYLHGEPDTPVTARYFIPLMIAVCTLAIVPFAFIPRRSLASGLAFSVGAYAFWVSSYWSIEAPALQLMERPTNSAAIARVLGGHEVQCNAVIVTGLTLHQVVRGFTAVPRSLLDSMTLEQLETYAGRELSIVDLEPYDRLPPPEFLERVYEHRGGSCQRTLLGITFISDLPKQPSVGSGK